MVLNAVKANTGTAPAQVLADAGYKSEAVMALLAKDQPATEPPNGWIKSVLGFRQFSMRGLQKANAEFKLVYMALNLRRMAAMQMG